MFIVDMLEEKYGRGIPIFTREILDTFPGTGRSQLYEMIRLAVMCNALKQFDRGVYYIPERGVLFDEDVPINPELVIKKKYLEDNGEVFGFKSGLNLQNIAHVSNQMPFTLEIITNKETNNMRHIRPFGGYRDIVLKRPRLLVTKDNVSALEAINLIETSCFEALNDFELSSLRKKYDDVDRKLFLDCLSAYPKKTMQKYLEGVSNGYLLA